MRIKFLLLGLLLMSPTVSFAQELMRFSVRVDHNRIEAPVSVSLDGINYNTDLGDLVLFQINKEGLQLIPSQIERGYSARLWFILAGIEKDETIRNYVIKAGVDSPKPSPGISLRKERNDLSLTAHGKPVLSYRFNITDPPEGADPLYRKSGYIHPVWSPGGEALTRIQPPDHYHHYGIWGPWTKTHIKNREVDFWNLSKGLGTVRFAGFISDVEGIVYSGFKVMQQHVDFGAAGEDQVALNEILDIRAWDFGENLWMVDYTTSLNCPLETGLMLDAYRYGGGIGFRATEKWHKDNCTVLTSENKTRIDADGSNARWCLVTGESDVKEGRSGILFLSHPSNRKHPEPMRVWPLDANGGRGDMFFEFAPIRHENWKLDPEQNYTLKYRMIIFDGDMNAGTAEKHWNSFASNPETRIE